MVYINEAPHDISIYVYMYKVQNRFLNICLSRIYHFLSNSPKPFLVAVWTAVHTTGTYHQPTTLPHSYLQSSWTY